MDKVLDHFSQVSMFGRSAQALILILAVNFAITALHSYQEWKGAGAPLWRNFGAIVGLDFPDSWGFLLFTVVLTLTLWAVGLTGIAGYSSFALGALIGARLSDTFVSHAFLYAAGYRPNPGLSSTPLYVLEAIFIAYAFQAGLSAHAGLAAFGFLLGVLAFIAVLPLLRVVWWLKPALRRTPWSRGRPPPQWASTNA